MQHDTDQLANADEAFRKQQHIWPRESEPREFDFVPLKRATRKLVGNSTAAIRFRRQDRVDKNTVFVDSEFAGDPVSRKSATGLAAQIGAHKLKSEATLHSWTAQSVGEAEFYAAVKGGQVGQSLRYFYMDLGIQMKVEIQSDSSTANFFDGSFGSGTKNETH